MKGEKKSEPGFSDVDKVFAKLEEDRKREARKEWLKKKKAEKEKPKQGQEEVRKE